MAEAHSPLRCGLRASQDWSEFAPTLPYLPEEPSKSAIRPIHATPLNLNSHNHNQRDRRPRFSLAVRNQPLCCLSWAEPPAADGELGPVMTY
jgi:hypothetical protein